VNDADRSSTASTPCSEAFAILSSKLQAFKTDKVNGDRHFVEFADALGVLEASKKVSALSADETYDLVRMSWHKPSKKTPRLSWLRARALVRLFTSFVRAGFPTATRLDAETASAILLFARTKSAAEELVKLFNSLPVRGKASGRLAADGSEALTQESLARLILTAKVRPCPEIFIFIANHVATSRDLDSNLEVINLAIASLIRRIQSWSNYSTSHPSARSAGLTAGSLLPEIARDPATVSVNQEGMGETSESEIDVMKKCIETLLRKGMQFVTNLSSGHKADAMIQQFWIVRIDSFLVNKDHALAYDAYTEALTTGLQPSADLVAAGARSQVVAGQPARAIDMILSFVSLAEAASSTRASHEESPSRRRRGPQASTAHDRFDHYPSFRSFGHQDSLEGLRQVFARALQDLFQMQIQGSEDAPSENPNRLCHSVLDKWQVQLLGLVRSQSALLDSAKVRVALLACACFHPSFAASVKTAIDSEHLQGFIQGPDFCSEARTQRNLFRRIWPSLVETWDNLVRLRPLEPSRTAEELTRMDKYFLAMVHMKSKSRDVEGTLRRIKATAPQLLTDTSFLLQFMYRCRDHPVGTIVMTEAIAGGAVPDSKFVNQTLFVDDDVPLGLLLDRAILLLRMGASISPRLLSVLLHRIQDFNEAGRSSIPAVVGIFLDELVFLAQDSQATRIGLDVRNRISLARGVLDAGNQTAIEGLVKPLSDEGDPSTLSFRIRLARQLIRAGMPKESLVALGLPPQPASSNTAASDRGSPKRTDLFREWYAYSIDAHSRMGNATEVNKIMDFLAKQRLAPTVSTYRAMVQVSTDISSALNAHYIWVADHLAVTVGQRPYESSLKIAESFARAVRMEAADEFVKILRARSALVVEGLSQNDGSGDQAKAVQTAIAQLPARVEDTIRGRVFLNESEIPASSPLADFPSEGSIFALDTTLTKQQADDVRTGSMLFRELASVYAPGRAQGDATQGREDDFDVLNLDFISMVSGLASRVASLREPHLAFGLSGKAVELIIAKSDGRSHSGAIGQALSRLLNVTLRACMNLGNEAAAKRLWHLAAPGYSSEPVENRGLVDEPGKKLVEAYVGMLARAGHRDEAQRVLRILIAKFGADESTNALELNLGSN
jgi:hypothetical protein